MGRQRGVRALIVAVCCAAVASRSSRAQEPHDPKAVQTAIAAMARELPVDPGELLAAAKRVRGAAAAWSARSPAGRRTTDAELLHDSLNLLVQLVYRRLAGGGDVADVSRELLSGYRLLDGSGAPKRLVTYRSWSQLALTSGQLLEAYRVIDRGLTATSDADPIERCLLSVLAGRLDCELGRLERAAGHVYRALGQVRELRDALADVRTPEEPQAAARLARARRRAEQVHRNAVLAVADLHLLDGGHERGLAALAALPSGDRVAAWYRMIFGVIGGDLEAEVALEAELEQSRSGFNRRLVRMAVTKLVQRAMERGDFERAAQRRERFRVLIDGGGDDREHRLDLVALEFALNGDAEARAAVRDRAERAFDELLERWRTSPRPAGGIGFLQQDDRSSWVCAMVRLALADDARSGCERALEVVLRAHAASAQLPADVTTAALRAALVDEHVGLLVYLPGRLRSILLVVDADGMTSVALPSAMQLRARVNALSDAAADALEGFGARDWRPAARAAAADLLPELVVRRMSSWRGVTVCGAGMLQNAPFDLLLVSGAGGDPAPLGLEKAVCYVANLVEAVGRPAPRALGRVCIGAALRTTRGGAEVLEVRPEEVAPLLAPYAEEARVPLLDEAVTTAALRRDMPRCAVVHLIAHGTDDPQRARPNGIAFGDDLATHGLFFDEVQGLDLSGAICIVGACHAGEAPWRRGDEPLETTLAGGMLRAGARCVLVPTTAITFGNHVDGMAVVHARLAAGDSPASALLRARRELAGRADSERAALELLLTQAHGSGH